jgi:alcohol dehydrogenase (cytochrome c)
MNSVKRFRGWVLAAAAVGAVLAFAVAAADTAVTPGRTQWTSWGRTTDQLRNSPLTQINRSNISRLGRVYSIDFRQGNQRVRLGSQSYPLVLGRRLYVTTNEGSVWAVDAPTGRIIYRYDPHKFALYSNFGIVANRGVAYCNGRIFIATLDMHLVMLRARDGKVLKDVDIAKVVPGASANYGYEQTSTPICAKGILLMGAAGSEYGIRGYVMAWRTSDLSPAWPNPYWTIPPESTEWRVRNRLVGGGAVWTPVTIDQTTNTVYFGTGSATPLYRPELRLGPAPRTDSLIAVNLFSGRQKWWQQQMSHNEWAYDTAQPPLVYTARVGGKTRRIVSVATMEGVWFAYDARTGRPIYQRVKVLDRIEHPRLKPGQPVIVYPSSLGGLNFSPASYDPRTNRIYNAAAETAAILIQERLTPTQKKRKRLGDVFLGLANGEFGSYLPGWKDFGSISAIDVNTGRRVWKTKTPQPERGGVTTTASGIGFAGGGDGVLRAFDLRNGRILWSFQTGNQIAAGPTVFAVAGKQYVAISVGGTPTSSNGGTGTKLQVFALGGSQDQSPGPTNLPFQRGYETVDGSASPAAAPAGPLGPARIEGRAAKTASTAAGPRGRIVTQRTAYVRRWQPSASNEQVVTGRLTFGGRPVSGVRMRVGRYRVANLTDKQGRFRYRADVTVARRYVISVSSAAGARINGRLVSTARRRAIARATGGFNVSFRFSGVKAKRLANGNVELTGRIAQARGTAPPAVTLLTYRLSGRITDANGNPVAGASVVTRTLDRDFWTFSEPSDAQGNYSSFFTASDKAGGDPVPMSVQVAQGDTTYTMPTGRNVSFKRLSSSRMDLKLPGSGTVMQLPDTTAIAGAIYEGTLVGVMRGASTVKPVSATWPDRKGNFRLVLPSSMRGKLVSFWMDRRQVFTALPGVPGGRVVPAVYPSAPRPQAPQRLLTLRLPR